MHTIDSVLSFWFEETPKEKHFSVDLQFDTEIIQRFGQLYLDILDSRHEDWKQSPRGILAQIIVLDQFSRNMFRGKKESFATDLQALELAKHMVQYKLDKLIPHDMRVFVYMPYMHSESKEVHVEALQIFTEYGNPINLHFEQEHKSIIDRFGRYPHRNSILGRVSTPEEEEFLKNHKGF